MIRRFVKKIMNINIHMTQLDNSVFYSSFRSLDPKDWHPISEPFNGSDTIEGYKENLDNPKYTGLFKNWRFKTDPIDYSFNNIGMRVPSIENNQYDMTDDYDFSDKIVILGCSHVQGVGIEYEHTIGEYLSKLTGRQVINWGVGGCGPDAVFHNAMWLATRERLPLKVIVLWPTVGRFSFTNPITNMIEYVIPPNVFDHGFSKFYKTEMLFGDIQKLQSVKYKNTLRNVFKDRLCEFDLWSGIHRPFSVVEKEFLAERDELVNSNRNLIDILNNLKGRDIRSVPKDFLKLQKLDDPFSFFVGFSAHNGKDINELIARRLIFPQLSDL